MEDNSILGNKVIMGDINQKWLVIIRIDFLLLVLIVEEKRRDDLTYTPLPIERERGRGRERERVKNFVNYIFI